MQKMSLNTVIDVDTLPFSGPQICKIDCDETERAALATRFGFAAVAELSARLKVKRAGPGHWNVTGRLQAEVTQLCGVTGEPAFLKGPFGSLAIPAAPNWITGVST